MKVTQAIRHHKDGRSISLLRKLLSFLLGLGIIASAASGSDFGFIPELDLAKKSFRVTSFMSTDISPIVTIRLGNDGISSRREDKEIRDHGRLFVIEDTQSRSKSHLRAKSIHIRFSSSRIAMLGRRAGLVGLGLS